MVDRKHDEVSRITLADLFASGDLRGVPKDHDPEVDHGRWCCGGRQGHEEGCQYKMGDEMPGDMSPPDPA